MLNSITTEQQLHVTNATVLETAQVVSPQCLCKPTMCFGYFHDCLIEFSISWFCVVFACSIGLSFVVFLNCSLCLLQR